MGNDQQEEITGINITPLVDVMLVLLVIFMVTTNYIEQAAIAIDLPTASSGEQDAQQKETVTFSIDREARLYYDDKPISMQEISALLADVTTSQISIRADRRTPHGKVVELIDLLRLQGRTSFMLQTINP